MSEKTVTDALLDSWAKNPPTVTEAVKALRIALDDTQQQFAQRLGLAISTVVRYESTRAPRGDALVKLVHLANANGLVHIVEMFRFAISSDAGLLAEIPENRDAFHLTLDLEMRLSKLESALADNRVKPKVRLDHALKEIWEIRGAVSAWNDRYLARAPVAEEKPESLAQERGTKE
jgi:transcriptional regulator with XRE-family HTH domain